MNETFVATCSALLTLPNELLEAIITLLPPDATIAFGTTCKSINKITYEPLVWRRHCRQAWQHWQPQHELMEKLELPPAQTKWRHLYNQRKKNDDIVLTRFNQMLLAQQNRMHAMEEIAEFGYDAKDMMLKLRNETHDAAEDVLARRYFANAVLGQIHRATAVGKWDRLSRRQMIRTEEALGAFDLFVLAGEKGDLDDLSKEFDRIAQAIKDRDPEFDDLSVRRRAVQIAKYLRAENLVGNPNAEDYHALRNNFISLALFDEAHGSLPLQSVAIYCAVARRLGISASPSNYPQHVHVVIKAPLDCSLDGKAKVSNTQAEAETMHMDPWRSSEEVPQDQLRLRLSQMGAPVAQHAYHLGATSTLEVALRTGRNIMTSVQEARDRHRQVTTRGLPDVEAAWYAMLWSMIILGDSNDVGAAHRRKQCLPYLIEHFQAHFPEDIGLIESIIPPLFDGEREQRIIMHIIESARVQDRTRKAPARRGATSINVAYKVGTPFTHKRYGYEGVLVGWDQKCSADPNWMRQMRVDDLARGKEQPFYHVVADDRSVRYVAEENIVRHFNQPSAAIMQLAGRYFKRWDDASGGFVSNLMEEYPDD